MKEGKRRREKIQWGRRDLRREGGTQLMPTQDASFDKEKL